MISFCLRFSAGGGFLSPVNPCLASPRFFTPISPCEEKVFCGGLRDAVKTQGLQAQKKMEFFNSTIFAPQNCTMQYAVLGLYVTYFGYVPHVD